MVGKETWAELIEANNVSSNPTSSAFLNLTFTEKPPPYRVCWDVGIERPASKGARRVPVPRPVIRQDQRGYWEHTSASSQTPRRYLGRRADSPAGQTAGETATQWNASTSRGEAAYASNSSWLPPHRNENARQSPSCGKKNVILVKPRRGLAGVLVL